MRIKYLLIFFLICFAVQFGNAQLNVKYEKFTLPNGLTVIMHEDHTVPVATCNIWYHVGLDVKNPDEQALLISSSI